jgi:hypothetical protein
MIGFMAFFFYLLSMLAGAFSIGTAAARCLDHMQ